MEWNGAGPEKSAAERSGSGSDRTGGGWSDRVRSDRNGADRNVCGPFGEDRIGIGSRSDRIGTCTAYPIYRSVAVPVWPPPPPELAVFSRRSEKAGEFCVEVWVVLGRRDRA